MKNKIQKTIGAISSAIDKREKYKVSKHTPQIKDAKFSGKPQIDKEER